MIVETNSIEPSESHLPLFSEVSSLLDVLKALSVKGTLRQIDYQFARFIASQVEINADEIGFIAGIVSHELGKGHICIQLNSEQGGMNDFASMLGLYGDTARALNQILLSVNWNALLEQSAVVGKEGQAVPLMLDDGRLYLHRYWNYESFLAETLSKLSKPVDLSGVQLGQLTKTLSHLFARSYHFLYKDLVKASKDGKSTQVLRQQLVCDHLDVVSSENLDWPAIDQILLSAQKTQHLNELERLVPEAFCLNWQKVAAAVALTRRFAVISGGPGTGKTTTVTKLLAALVEQAQAKLEDDGLMPTIKLVAPTGKAAARLTESIGKAVAELPLDPLVKKHIPTESSTLHRLLGAIPNRAEFRHHRHNHLHVDILVVDEASMVDLPMMFKLLDALPSDARLILLGDKDQLSSVEAGAVLGDICSFNDYGFSQAQSKSLAQLTGYQTLASSRVENSIDAPICDSLCMLQKSYRFDARSGIGQLAKAINTGKAQQVESVLTKGFNDIQHCPLSADNYNQMITTLVANYRHYLDRISHNKVDEVTDKRETQEQKALAVLALFSQCRLLCAIREGDFGVTGLNQRIETRLAARRLIQTTDELWYVGRPVMVTRNDHGLGLYNGDIGICMLDDSESEPRLKVYFELPDGSVKSVLPSRVPEHETAYAMTIHKSQGSEFELTVMILPPDFSPILTRELIYTGVTRAKKELMLFADLSVLKRGIKIKTERVSGLVQRLKVKG